MTRSRPLPSIEPRLIDEHQAARYLGNIPVSEVKRQAIGAVPIGRHVRYDRVALDRYLDGLAGLTSDPTTQPSQNDADAALDRFFDQPK